MNHTDLHEKHGDSWAAGGRQVCISLQFTKHKLAWFMKMRPSLVWNAKVAGEMWMGRLSEAWCVYLIHNSGKEQMIYSFAT